MSTTYSTSVAPKAASGHGDIDGFTVTCTCGDESTWSLPAMANNHARDHEDWHARNPQWRPARENTPVAQKADGPSVEAKALASNIRKRIRLYRRATVLPSGTAWQGSFRVIGLLAESNAYGWFGQVDTAVQGIAYAINTGRVSGTVAQAIRDLSDWDVCALIAETALACTVIGEVPQYLIKRFAA